MKWLLQFMQKFFFSVHGLSIATLRFIFSSHCLAQAQIKRFIFPSQLLDYTRARTVKENFNMTGGLILLLGILSIFKQKIG